MPTTIRLSWHEARSCWKKYYHGRHYYVGKGQCKGKSDLDGYRAALAEWDALKREIDQLEATRQQAYGQQAITMPRPDAGGDGLNPLDFAARMATDWSAVGAKPSVSALARSRITASGISSLAAEFIKLKKVELDTGNISPKMYIQYKDKLDDFVQWTGHPDIRVTNVAGINSTLLMDYRNRQMELLSESRKGKRGHSSWTVKKRLAAVSQFVQWLWSSELIDTLPRCMTKGFVAVPTSKPNPKFFTPDEVQRLFNAATQRTKLYVALGLNCGYRQTDIATLRHEHIDWKAGVINRQRHKTGETQCHKLWQVTKELLGREKTDTDTGIVLLSDEGTELYREWISDDDRFVSCDCIRLAFDRLMLSSGMDTKELRDKRRFETFRDTGANLIEKAFQDYPHLSSQYLAHKETAMKSRYVKRHFDLLFTALDHLEAVFALKL